ncbi:cytochrome oxidase c subunit VIb-domain-containing protein [Sparassis latifolia]|uniref:Cytochrome c oxidase assembly factor 6 n=1 Tax=Sparassis crispa TaxID=139825 RepID=A0A401H6U8_9APHY|nr:Cytochrome c oxidase assembly factor 6 [Sparassis crispa]GBE90103.1 Cytochrome c oxidase assembly factor 6 [Sparassis crispa]
MGWFGGVESTKPDPASRKDRQKCWENRDAYFTCLDGAGIVKPGEEGSICAASKTAYEQSCAKSWIDYFNQRRVLAEQQQGILTQKSNQDRASRL